MRRPRSVPPSPSGEPNAFRIAPAAGSGTWPLASPKAISGFRRPGSAPRAARANASISAAAAASVACAAVAAALRASFSLSSRAMRSLSDVACLARSAARCRCEPSASCAEASDCWRASIRAPRRILSTASAWPLWASSSRSMAIESLVLARASRSVRTDSICDFNSGMTALMTVAARTASDMSLGLTRMAGGGLLPMR